MIFPVIRHPEKQISRWMPRIYPGKTLRSCQGELVLKEGQKAFRADVGEACEKRATRVGHTMASSSAAWGTTGGHGLPLSVRLSVCLSCPT